MQATRRGYHKVAQEIRRSQRRPILTLVDLIGIFATLELPGEIVELIFAHYRPKFAVGQRCIRTLTPHKHSVWWDLLGRSPNQQQLVQLVTITDLYYDYSRRQYMYPNEYFPSSQGFGLEADLRALTAEEEPKPHWKLPHDMEPMY